jgi:hypothetical protein
VEITRIQDSRSATAARRSGVPMHPRMPCGCKKSRKCTAIAASNASAIGGKHSPITILPPPLWACCYRTLYHATIHSLSVCAAIIVTRGQPGRASELSRQMTAFLVRFAQFDVVTGSLHPCGFIIFHSRT